MEISGRKVDKYGHLWIDMEYVNQLDKGNKIYMETKSGLYGNKSNKSGLYE